MKKKLLLGIAAMTLAFSLVGCGSNSSNGLGLKGEMADVAATEESVSSGYYDDYAYEDALDDGYESESVANETVGTISNSSNSSATNEKIVTTYNYTLQTKVFDEFVAKVNDRIYQYGGYIENSDLTGNKEWQDRVLNMTIRIPQEHASDFLNMVEDGATVTGMSTTTENVSLKYVDLQSHISTLRSEMESLTALLENAYSVDDIVSLTDRISYIRYEIESYESQLRVLQNRVSYDTIKMRINEVKEEAIVVPMSYGSELAYGLVETFTNIGEGFRDFSLGFMINFPYFVVFILINGIIAGIVIAIVRGAIRSSKKRAEKKAALEAKKKAATENK